MAAKPAKSKPKPNPVSEKDAQAFDAFLAHWQSLLNLRDWWIARMPDRDLHNMAIVASIEHEHKLVKIKIGETFGKNMKVTPLNLEKTAVHELLHVMLRTIIDEAIGQGEYNDAVLGYEHGVINVLEPLLQKAYGVSKG